MRLLQGVLARGGDVAAEIEVVECLEIRTSYLVCYFFQIGVGNVATVI